MKSGLPNFSAVFDEFKKLCAAYDGHPFTNFREGFVATWEDYKLRLREEARRQLQIGTWSGSRVGEGHILDATIRAIELPKNNLVFWANRYGHAAREHAALLEARHDAKARRSVEAALYELYVDQANEEHVFEALSTLVRRKYPLLGYLYFLKDENRFMPIQPTGFDRTFKALGVELKTLGNCSFANYAEFNRILAEVVRALEETVSIKRVPLIDAHSFCWVYASLSKERIVEPDNQAGDIQFAKHADPGRRVGGRDRSILDMRQSILNTVAQARGQLVDRTIQMKLKDLRIDPAALEKHLRELLHVQQDRCNLTGIPFHFAGEASDQNLLPSADRIDSDSHYAPGNIQLVCRFINFWKGNTPDAEFRRLLDLVRTGGDLEQVPNELDRDVVARDIRKAIPARPLENC